MANRVKEGIDMPICYPRLVQTGLHQTDFPTLCWFETDRLRMGGVVRHTQHTLGTPLLVFPGCVGYGAWRARSSPRKPTCQHIFGSGETGVSALTPIATPLHYLFESVDLWCRSRPGEKENYQYTHNKIRDPVERCPCAGPYGGARGLRL